MTLLLTESDVRSLLTMPLAIEAVEASFRRLAEGRASVHPRRRLHVPDKSYLHYMAAADAEAGCMGLKIYTVAKGGLRFLVPLFDANNGELLTLIEADYLGQVRTGAASGVATRHMARSDAHTVGIIGTGSQARTQLEAVANVRRLERACVFGRDQGKRARFAAEMQEALHIPVEAVDTAEKAIRGTDIVITATTAAAPVLDGNWISPGAHINAIGANFANKRELDDTAVDRASVIAVDSREQSQMESGDLILAFQNDASRWNAVVELSEIVSAKIPGRATPDQITLFKSNGIATEDIAVAERLYKLAKERGIGRSIPLWEKEMRQGADRKT